MNKKRKAVKPLRHFYVWFPQVNQVRIEVSAANAGEAAEKAERIWRRDYGNNEVISMREVVD